MKKVFIDGEAGTTGLRIRERLAARTDIELVTLPEALRKDAAARKTALNAADITRLNACEVFGTSTTRSLASCLVNFVGYGSDNCCTCSVLRFLRCAAVSKKLRTRMRSGPVASLSSSFSTNGCLPLISFIMRMISSDKYASCPHPKLTTCAYSR